MEKIDLNDFAGQGQIASIFALYLPEVVEKYPELRIIVADMSYGARLDRFKSLCPNQFINVGIAEQNMIGVAAGLSSEKFKCICIAQAAFITMRDFEQVRQYCGYMGYPMVLIGLSAGLGMQFMGNTHYAVEDMSIMRGIPGMIVLSPADAGEAVKAFDYAINCGKPVYLRLTGSLTDESVYSEDFEYSPMKANIVKDGSDIVIFTTGSMVIRSLKAASIIEESLSKTVRVIDMHSISPLDKEVILQAKESSLLVVVEEHYTNGGLGTAVADVISEYSGFPALLKLGIQNKYSVVGDYNFLLNQHRLTIECIAEDIINKFKNIV